MGLRTARTVAGRAIALLATGLVLVVLTLGVVVPRLAGADSYTILTGSMRPTMPPGTLVVVRHTPPEQVRVGDVLTYQLRSGDPTVATHRVVGIGRTVAGDLRFTLQGDANHSPDPVTVRPEQIRGTRWYAVPYLAYPSLLVDGNVRQIVVMGAVLVLLGYAAMSFAGAARDRVRGKDAEVSGPVGEPSELVGAAR
ncbi:signal peptidase I [Marmoricola sp. RAF53]|uniref:signal peptidase I n=1 Tax=Marmoricola sp. RAF53 TaxID=3233059 RepID=UPI003F9CCBCD